MVPLDRETIHQSAAEALLKAREIEVDLYDLYHDPIVIWEQIYTRVLQPEGWDPK